jgi:hypothetical protein
MSSEGIDVINRRLEEHYGLDVSVSKPNYRIVWTSSQYEIRINPEGFDIYGDEGIFLRTEFGPHECEKYPEYPDMWVLEALQPKTARDTPILVDPVQYSYEPLFIFGAGRSNPQPIWKAVNFLVHAHKFRAAVIEKKTDRDLLIEDMKALAKEKEDCKMYLQNENPPLATALHSGEAVLNAKEKSNDI